MKKKLLLLFTLIIPVSEYAQSFSDQYPNRSEYVFGIGPSNIMTNIGGSALQGTHFLRDFNLPSIRFGGFLGYRKRISSHFAIKGILTLGEFYGNDNLSSNKCRYNRNQDFRTQITEASIQGEYHLFKSKKWKRNGDQRPPHWDLYFFGGIGEFYFNVQGKYNPGGSPPPKGMNTSEWYNLRPLSTEGEGLPGGPKEYSPFAICFPLGVGLNYVLNANWSIGLEFSDRVWTSTSYMDDTKGNYFNKAEVLQYKGPIAAYFSDPSRGLIEGQDMPGQERGDPKRKDVYMFVFFCVNYHPTFIMQHGSHTARFRGKGNRHGTFY